jgi:DNA-binding beta-propeller fold protein YncE
MGVVYRATQVALNRMVALKVITPELADDELFRERFQREALIAASIDHPNVIPVYAAGEADGLLYIAMRYVEGTDLSELLRHQAGLPSVRAVRIVEQVAGALDAAHRRGLVHRDVKPANVLLADEGEEHVYLTDFGLTKHAASVGGMTKTGQFIGTPDYTAPEQIRGERSDARTDVYALGCVLYQALTGRVPFQRDTEVAKIYAHLTDSPPSLADTAPEAAGRFDAVVGRALAKDPGDRYPSAGDLGRAARAALHGTVQPTPERTIATGVAAPETRPADAVTAPSPGPPPGAAGPTARPAGAPGAAPPPGGPTTAPGALAPPRAGAPTAPAGKRRPLLVGLAAVAAAAVVAAGLAVAGVFSSDDEPAPGGEQAQGQPEVAASIRVGTGPDGIAVAGDTVWVSLAGNGSVTPIDARTNRPRKPIPVGKNPDGVAVAGPAVWVVLSDDDAVRRIDEAYEAPVLGASVEVGDRPEGISIGEQLVWVVNSGSDSVSRLDRATATYVGSQIGVGALPIGVFVGRESTWITNNGDDSVTRINTKTSEIIDMRIPVGDKPRGVVQGAGSVWVANSGDGTVSRLDARSGEPMGQPIQVGRNSRDIAFGEGFVWVTSRDENSVTRIDPESGRVVGSPIPVGTEPLGVAVGAGSVWVANFRDNTVTRIDP